MKVYSIRDDCDDARRDDILASIKFSLDYLNSCIGSIMFIPMKVGVYVFGFEKRLKFITYYVNIITFLKADDKLLLPLKKPLASIFTVVNTFYLSTVDKHDIS